MKNLFTILLLTLFITNIIAQSKKVNVGVMAGPSIDWLSSKNDQYEQGGIILGLRYGVPLDINLTEDENYYFSTGIKLEHTGGKIKYKTTLDTYPNEEVSYTRKYNSIFLSIPTGIKLKTPSFNNFVIAGSFGLSHAFALNSTKFDRITTVNKEIKDQKKTKYENGSFFKESLFAGLGVEYIIKDNFRATFMINYSYTFINYHNRKELVFNSTTERLKNNLNSVEFIFGIFF